MRQLLVGVGLTVVVTGLLALAFGRAAVVAAASFGLLATAIQLAAVAALKPALHAPFAEAVRRWAVGVGLRLIGVLLIPVAVVADATLFPPIPAAFGYLGVLIPLFFAETRFLR